MRKIINMIRSTAGQNAVEFAMILPLLLLMIFAIVDLSRFVYNTILINQAAKEAARLTAVGQRIDVVAGRIGELTTLIIGSTPPVISSGVSETGNACTIITFTPPGGASLKAELTPPYNSSLTKGSMVTLSLKYRMEFITPIRGIFGNQADMAAKCVTRMEGPPQ